MNLSSKILKSYIWEAIAPCFEILLLLHKLCSKGLIYVIVSNFPIFGLGYQKENKIMMEYGGGGWHV